MLKFDRSTRRHHYRRLIAKRLRENARVGTGMRMADTWRLENAQVRARTGCVCSCEMCGNPRRRRGNSAYANTLQQWRASFWKEQLE